MVGSYQPIRDFWNYSILGFLFYYKNTLTAWITGTLTTIFWISSSIFGSHELRIVSVLTLVLPALFTYLSKRPFNIRMSLTPTHLVDGQREPDLMSKKRGKATIQNGKAVISGRIDLASTMNKFEVMFDGSDALEIELRARPRKEHDYDPDSNILRCGSISEYEFPVTIEVYPVDQDAPDRRHYQMEVQDKISTRTLATIEIETI